jgi:hypothetical protein
MWTFEAELFAHPAMAEGSGDKFSSDLLRIIRMARSRHFAFARPLIQLSNNDGFTAYSPTY